MQGNSTLGARFVILAALIAVLLVSALIVGTLELAHHAAPVYCSETCA